jgi:hypothetical protein
VSRTVTVKLIYNRHWGYLGQESGGSMLGRNRKGHENEENCRMLRAIICTSRLILELPNQEGREGQRI